MKNPFTFRALAAAALLLLAPPASAQGPEADGLAPVASCLERNIPRRASEQVIEFTTVDRIGGKRVSRAKIIAKRFDDGNRRVLLRFTKPLEMRGSSLLIIEAQDGPNDMFLYTPELRKVKRVTSNSSGGSLFGTDFTYEDFERWQLLNRPGGRKRLPDATVSERPVYVVETRPQAESGSSYEKVVTYIDRETCVVLKSESFERGERLRKVLTASPSSVIEEGGIHVASEIKMQDVRDETYTDVIVEDLEVDHDVPDADFTISKLSRRR